MKPGKSTSTSGGISASWSAVSTQTEGKNRRDFPLLPTTRPAAATLGTFRTIRTGYPFCVAAQSTEASGHLQLFLHLLLAISSLFQRQPS
jgi:hypothetical protein